MEKMQASIAAKDLAEDTESEEEEEEKDEPQQQGKRRNKLIIAIMYITVNDGVAHGDGQWQYRDGEIYTGESVNGKRDGFGILESIFGDRLIGNDLMILLFLVQNLVRWLEVLLVILIQRMVGLFGKIISKNGDIYIGECNKNYDNTYGAGGLQTVMEYQ